MKKKTADDDGDNGLSFSFIYKICFSLFVYLLLVLSLFCFSLNKKKRNKRKRRRRRIMNSIRLRRHTNQKKRKEDEKREKGLFMETYAVAPAPSRDYHALKLYQNRFVWIRWKISHGPYANPIQRIVSLDEFQKDVTMKNELTYIFGSDTTSLISDLANEKWSLVSMPSHILQKIFSYVTVTDILRLSQVCKRLSKECSRNELWQTICKKQWKILIHNDIEKASLIGWKRVYLEKMRPKRYKTDPNYKAKPNILQRSRVQSASTLNSPDSRISTTKSNFTIHKRIQELKKSDAVRSSSEIFKVTSTSTGKSTDRTLPPSRKSLPRNNEFRLTSGLIPSTPKSDRKSLYESSHSVINLMPLRENPKENDGGRKKKSPRMTKSKVISIRTRSVTSQAIQPTENESVKSKTGLTRPNTGKSAKTNTINK